MEAKISKAQLEVWEWKEEAYEDMKHLSTREQMALIHEQTRDVIENVKKKKHQLRQKI